MPYGSRDDARGFFSVAPNLFTSFRYITLQLILAQAYQLINYKPVALINFGGDIQRVPFTLNT